MRLLHRQSAGVIYNWNRCAESSIAEAVFGDRHVIRDLMQEVRVSFHKDELEWCYAVDVFSWVLGLDGLVDGEAHAHYDAQMISLIRSVLLHVELERNSGGIRDVGDPPAELLARIRPPLTPECSENQTMETMSLIPSYFTLQVTS